MQAASNAAISDNELPVRIAELQLMYDAPFGGYQKGFCMRVFFYNIQHAGCRTNFIGKRKHIFAAFRMRNNDCIRMIVLRLYYVCSPQNVMNRTRAVINNNLFLRNMLLNPV